MSFALRTSLCLLALSLSFSPALAQTQSVSNPPALPEVKDLVAALLSATSEEEQERLLARNSTLMNSSILAGAEVACRSPRSESRFGPGD